MFIDATAQQPTLKYFSTDHDPLFRFHRWLAHLRGLEDEELEVVPYVPVSRPFIEPLNGTIRREYVDHQFSWNPRDLSRKLEEWGTYHVHRALGESTPTFRVGSTLPNRALLDRYRWKQLWPGLFQTPVAP